MGRPSKLTEAQWDELKSRLLSGEKAADLSREYGVSKAAISTRVSKRVEEVKAVANQLVSAEVALKALPINEQFMARSMADDLVSIRRDIAAAGRYQAATAHRMAAITQSLTEKVDDVDPGSNADLLRTIAGTSKIANDAATLPVAILNANRDPAKRALEEVEVIEAETIDVKSLPVLDAAKAYQDFVSGQ